MLNWGLLKGHLIIPKSASDVNQRENLDVFDFELDEEEMRMIEGLDKNRRLMTKFKFYNEYDVFA